MEQKKLLRRRRQNQKGKYEKLTTTFTNGTSYNKQQLHMQSRLEYIGDYCKSSLIQTLLLTRALVQFILIHATNMYNEHDVQHFTSNDNIYMG